MKCPECGEEMTPKRETWCEHMTARYEEAHARISEKLKPLSEGIRRSQILTAEDLNTRVNCVPD